jgi:hypothetical protein
VEGITVDLNGAMDILLANVMEELQKPGHDSKLCHVTKYPGAEVPTDVGAESGCMGQLYVTYTTAFPTTTFPNPGITDDNCTYTLAFPLQVGIHRTVPVMSNPFGGTPQYPSDTDLSNATEKQVADMLAMHRAIQRLRDDVEQLVIGTYTPTGPDGGAVGGYWSLTIGLD